jgi:hypothetical protein
MGDAVSCGLTQRIRQAGGFDDVVNKDSGWYAGGQVAGTVVAIAAGGANPCGAAKGLGLAIRGLSAVQGAGQLANAAEAAKNGDPLSFALNVVGARMSFNKMAAACFAAGTPLLDSWMTAKPIEEFRPGDLILARDEHDPNGTPVLMPVEDVFVNEARILHLHVAGQVIRTTAEHPFWLEGRGWTPAGELQSGDRLVGHDWQTVTVEEAYDTGDSETVYNLRVANYHTYFVGCPEWGWSAWAHNAYSASTSQLQKKFKHASDFGVSGNANKANIQAYDQALRNHVSNPAVQAVHGTYRGNPAIIHVDPTTGLAVVTDKAENFISGWKLSAQQFWHVMNGGNLGGG